MDDVRTHDAQEPPDPRNGVKDGTPQSQNQQRRIEHATTATVTNDRYTTICTLEIRPTKDDSATATNTIHRRIFDAIKEIDDTAVIITLEQPESNVVKTCPQKKNTKRCSPIGGTATSPRGNTSHSSSNLHRQSPN